MLPTGWWPSGVVVRERRLARRQRDARPRHGPAPALLPHRQQRHRRADARRHPARPGARARATSPRERRSWRRPTYPPRSPGRRTVSCPAGVRRLPRPGDQHRRGRRPSSSTSSSSCARTRASTASSPTSPAPTATRATCSSPPSSDMDSIWHNLRTLARTFAVSDNYYTDAIYSTQGHVWATYGRTNDFNERTWAISGSGRNARAIPGGGVIAVGKPVEGSLFDWLADERRPVQPPRRDRRQPRRPTRRCPPRSTASTRAGRSRTSGTTTSTKACYTAGRARVLCDLGQLHLHDAAERPHVRRLADEPDARDVLRRERRGHGHDRRRHHALAALGLLAHRHHRGRPLAGRRARRQPPGAHRVRLAVGEARVRVAHAHRRGVAAQALRARPRQAVPTTRSSRTPRCRSTCSRRRRTSRPTRTRRARGRSPAVRGASRAGDRASPTSWTFDDPDEQPGLDSQVTRWMRGVQR